MKSNHRRQPCLEAYLDPALLQLAANAAYLYAANRFMDFVADGSQRYLGLATALGYGIVIPAQFHLNKIISPGLFAVKEYRESKSNSGNHGPSCLVNGIKIVLVAGLLYLGSHDFVTKAVGDAGALYDKVTSVMHHPDLEERLDGSTQEGNTLLYSRGEGSD